MSTTLDIQGVVRIEGPGGPLAFHGQGDELEMVLPPGASFASAKSTPVPTPTLSDALESLGLRLNVSWRNQRIGVVGRDARPSRIARWAGFGRVQVHWPGLLKAVVALHRAR